MTAAAWWIRQKRNKVPVPWKIERIYSMESFDLPDVKWIERYVVGITHPAKWLTQDEINKQLEVVNRALRIGKLLAIERNFTILKDNKDELLMSYSVYHVGFKYRPPGK